MTIVSYVAFAITVVWTAPRSYAQSCEPEWSGAVGVPGMDDRVWSLTVYDDGTDPALYAVGDFLTAGGVSAQHIARWDGGEWTPVGGGLEGTLFLAQTVFDDGGGPALYVGGLLSSAGGVPVNGLARWDGVEWSAVGENGPGFVFSLAATQEVSPVGPALYAGGNFVDGVRKWDGSQWSSLGTGPFGIVEALVMFDDGSGEALYAAGRFEEAGGKTVNKIAKWDGTSWSPLGEGLTCGSLPRAAVLSVFDDGSGPALYVGGEFCSAGGIPAENIARWNGSSWSPLADGTSYAVFALWVFDDGSGPALYSSGSPQLPDGGIASGVGKWDGLVWSALGAGITSTEFTADMTSFDDGLGPALYVGGDFSMAGGMPVGRVARWGCLPIPGDQDGDGDVDAGDLALLLGDWGPCPDPCTPGEPAETCDADLNGDCEVGAFDLATLLGNWGP
jgi:hypothetical protein